MEIKILGSGCAKCKNLFDLTEKALKELNLDATVAKEEDIVKIMSYGVMSTPALVIDGKVIFSGKVPTLIELKSLFIIK